MSRSSGSAALDEGQALIVMKLYFDGSTGQDDSQHERLTLAWLIAPNYFWKLLEDRWTPMLHNRYPKAPYIHMTDLLAHVDPFEWINGWSDDRIDNLIQDAIRLLFELKHHLARLSVQLIRPQ
jgi:hypothetical protein